MGMVTGYVDDEPPVQNQRDALAAVRVRVFRHVHDLSMLHVQAERRGALVSRATADVDQITSFLQWNGVVLLTCIGQTLVTAHGDGLLLLAAHPGGAGRVRAGGLGGPGVHAPPGRTPTRRCASGRPTCSRRLRKRRRRRGDSRLRRVGAHRATGSTARWTASALAANRASRLTVAAFSVGELATGVALAAVVAVGVAVSGRTAG